MPYACTTIQVTTEQEGGDDDISVVHKDVIETHILTRLDGPSLASAAATCSQLRALSSNDLIWSNICRSTWPSTTAPRLRHVISTFPNASRSFFSDAFPAAIAANHWASRASQLISAVDLFHGDRLILSKVVETETESGWFLCSPFRIDILDPKEAVRTPVRYPRGDEDACRALGGELRLSWIVIDPKGRRAVNVSSGEAVWVERHWLSGEVQAGFSTVVRGGERGSAREIVTCGVTVTCGGEVGGEMHVREVSLLMEDLEGAQLNGRDSLGNLQRALEGKRGNAAGVKQGFSEFMDMKRERKDRKLRREKWLDMLSVAIAAVSFAWLSCLFLF